MCVCVYTSQLTTLCDSSKVTHIFIHEREREIFNLQIHSPMAAVAGAGPELGKTLEPGV